MNIKKFISLGIFTALAAVVLTFGVSAQEMMKKEQEKPIVAVISADWCPYCKRVEPVIADLMKEYGERMTFVIFDVTDDNAVKESMKKAEMLGLSDFFKDFKKKTSAVAVLKNKEIVFKAFNNNKREEYVKAFDKALE
jgi:thiol-disulfide isomerase/thioredoxin